MDTSRRNKEFAKNTLILFAGKFSTQFISFLFLPLYTYFLATSDYGYVDLIQTYIVLFVPIITLRIDSAVFRFLIDSRENENEKTSIITNSLLIMIFGCLFTFFIGGLIIILFDFRYKISILLNIIILLISNVLLQILRGLGRNIDYSIASIITGIFTFLFNCFFIIILKCGANSILLSSSIANIICILYIIINVNLFKFLKLEYINKKITKKILKYSLPMIPNALSWWIVNTSDRTIISIFLGNYFNGIYAISCKFSNILNSVFSIFNMSWQEMASIHINDKDRDEYFSNTISKIFSIFISISLIIVAFLPFFYNVIIGHNYSDAFKYIPLLLYANLINVISGLIGSIYIALKKTKEIAYTTIISAILNIIINLLFIKNIGLYAAILSTLISYMTIFIYRYVDVKKYININISFVKLFIFSVFFAFCSFLYCSNLFLVRFINLMVISIFVFVVNKGYIIYFINLIKKRLLKK